MNSTGAGAIVSSDERSAPRFDTLMPDPRLRATVMPMPGFEPDAVLAACEHWSRRRLTAPERPVRFELPERDLITLADGRGC